MAENNELELESGHFDAVLMVLSYHDIYYVDAANGWQRIDGPQLLREIYDGLKPGRVCFVARIAPDFKPGVTSSVQAGFSPRSRSPDQVFELWYLTFD